MLAQGTPGRPKAGLLWGDAAQWSLFLPPVPVPVPCSLVSDEVVFEVLTGKRPFSQRQLLSMPL